MEPMGKPKFPTVSARGSRNSESHTLSLPGVTTIPNPSPRGLGVRGLGFGGLGFRG